MAEEKEEKTADTKETDSQEDKTEEEQKEEKVETEQKQETIEEEQKEEAMPEEQEPEVMQEKEKKLKNDDNTILIGRKNTMSYVLAVMTQFNQGTTEVNVKARGKSISKAVDVAEIVRNKFAKDAKVKNISIATDRIKTEEGRELNVSSISIELGK